MRSLILSGSTRVRLLRGSGVLLILLGIVHLAATPHIATLIRHSASTAAADQLTPPMLLNHILVGLLLFPLGRTVAVSAWISNGLCRAIFGGWPRVGTSDRADDCSHGCDATRDAACPYGRTLLQRAAFRGRCRSGSCSGRRRARGCFSQITR